MNCIDFRPDKSWTLFLDRDGVINKKIDNDYVKSWSEFVFLPGVLEALAICKKIFGRIIILSNQQGIGKGLMTLQQLEEVHKQMLTEIKKNHGHIDMIYFSPSKAEMNDPMRKPDVGMALQAKLDFPEINFGKSVMLGDSMSDMELGFQLHMINVLVTEKTNSEPEMIHLTVRSLKEFCQLLAK
jgi:histidinol-phosphate phosphatase family protein